MFYRKWLYPFLVANFLVVLSMFGPTVAEAQSPCGEMETVARGDTLYEISPRCSTTVAALLAANPQITDRNLIRVGQVITIPDNDDDGEPQPSEPTVSISPRSGPPNTVLNVTVQNFPANAEVIVGLGEVESELSIEFERMTDASGHLDTQLEIPGDAQPNQRFVALTFIPEPNGDRATSDEFVTISEMQAPSATISPTHGSPGTFTLLESGGYEANLPVEIGFGRVASEYDIIAQSQTNRVGRIESRVQVPFFAESGDEYVFVIVPSDTQSEVISNVFTVMDNGESTNPQVNISPLSGPPGSNVQVALIGFPANTRISYGLGEPNGQLLKVFSARTSRNGSAQLTLPVPEVDAGTDLVLTVYVPREGGTNIDSRTFTVTQRDDNGNNLFTRTNIYLIALEDGGESGMEIGCNDSIIPVEVEIEPTIAPLTAALETLFNIDERFYGQSGLYNALYRSELAVERIDIVNGLATIYLTGDFSIGGVCDSPRVRTQLEEIALQYVTVDEVRVFINGETLDSLLSGRG